VAWSLAIRSSLTFVDRRHRAPSVCSRRAGPWRLRQALSVLRSAGPALRRAL